MSTKKEYEELLEDPKWTKKRNHIMGRDNYLCQITFDNKEPICVHHKRYIEGKKPWEYEDEDLITISQEVHGQIHKVLKNKHYYETFNQISKHLECTPTDLIIVLIRLFQISHNEGKDGIKSAIKLLTDYVAENYDIRDI